MFRFLFIPGKHEHLALASNGISDNKLVIFKILGIKCRTKMCHEMNSWQALAAAARHAKNLDHRGQAGNREKV
jgi:hypothetical protein